MAELLERDRQATHWERVPTVTGAQNSFNCYDVAGEANYGTCVSR